MAYVYGYDESTPHFDVDGQAYGSWFSKAVKSVGKSVRSTVRNFDITSNKSVAGRFAKTTVGKILIAPVATFAAPLKATTWALAQTGLKPFKQLESEAHRLVTKTPIKGILETQAVMVGTAAAVGLTALTGGGALAAIAAAAPGASLLATNKATYKGGLTALVGGAAAGLAVTGAGALVQSSKPSASPATATPVAALPGATDSAPRAAGGVIGPAAGAAGGFLVGGPIGAAVGAGVGFWLGRKKG